MQDKHKNILLKVLFVLSVLGMLPLLGGVGTKLGLWEPMTGFLLTMKYMVQSSISAAIMLFFIFAYFIRDRKRAVASYILALFFAGAGYIYGVNQEPTDWTGLMGVHDITTDMENPPEFRALLDAPGRRNSFDYPQETAERQKAKFPWVKPLITEMAPVDAFDRALVVAKELGWNIAATDPSAGRFEATDYSKWFHFNDDIVVRVSADGAGSRVDIRCLTRVGGTDHGLGAIRIMKFKKQFLAS